MNIGFSSINYNQIVWAIVIIIAIVIVLAVVRFFWKHILKYLVQGCAVILVIIAILAVLHYFKIF